MNDFFEAFNVGVEARSFAGLELDEADYGLNVWTAWGGVPDQAYGPVTVRDHIAAKLAGSRQGRTNVSAVREAARVRAAAR